MQTLSCPFVARIESDVFRVRLYLTSRAMTASQPVVSDKMTRNGPPVGRQGGYGAVILICLHDAVNLVHS